MSVDVYLRTNTPRNPADVVLGLSAVSADTVPSTPAPLNLHHGLPPNRRHPPRTKPRRTEPPPVETEVFDVDAFVLLLLDS